MPGFALQLVGVAVAVEPETQSASNVRPPVADGDAGGCDRGGAVVGCGGYRLGGGGGGRRPVGCRRARPSTTSCS